MLRRFYDWILSKAEHPKATHMLAATAFAESSFFPVPPDLLLIPMVIARREKAWFYAAIATVFSVLGGFLGYAIGYFFFETVGRWIIDTYGLQVPFDHFQESFNKYGTWVILIKGFTPIPYKLVTIAAGITKFDLFSFAWASLVTRGMRFFLLSALLYKFGAPVREFIEKYLVWCTMGLAALILLGIVLVAKI